MKKLNYPFHNFYEIVEENAKRFKNKTIIYDEGNKKITSLEFQKRVDSFARFLEISGISKGDKVALVLANSSEFVISIFAITKIGAVVVPINNFLKSEELEYILKDSQAKMLITQTKFHKELKHLKENTNIKRLYGQTTILTWM